MSVFTVEEGIITMKLSVLIITTLGVTLNACKKDTSDNNGPGVSIPNIGLVAPSDYKNTAKNGTDVGRQLTKTSESLQGTDFASGGGTKMTGPLPSSTTQTIASLDSLEVNNFLAGDDQGATSAKDAVIALPQPGGNCADSLGFLNGVYQSSALALNQTATTLAQLDAQNLPKGIIREPVSEQFAVAYTIDLSAMESPTNATRQPGLTGPWQMKSTGGIARIGAGANEQVAVVGLGFSSAMESQVFAGSTRGELSIAAIAAEKALKLNLSTNVNLISKDENQRNGESTGTSSILLVSGDNPSVQLTIAGSGTLVPQFRQLSGEETVLAFPDAAPQFSANLKIEKVAGNRIRIVLKTHAESSPSDTQVIELTTDEMGQCVVKDSELSANRD